MKGNRRVCHGQSKPRTWRGLNATLLCFISVPPYLSVPGLRNCYSYLPAVSGGAAALTPRACILVMLRHTIAIGAVRGRRPLWKRRPRVTCNPFVWGRLAFVHTRGDFYPIRPVSKFIFEDARQVASLARGSIESDETKLRGNFSTPSCKLVIVAERLLARYVLKGELERIRPCYTVIITFPTFFFFFF